MNDNTDKNKKEDKDRYYTYTYKYFDDYIDNETVSYTTFTTNC
jgi:hypothetical protein